MRQMRRRYQQVDDPATLERWLDEALVGRLATVDEDGFPVIKPVNFVYSGGKILFHSAREGEKLDDIRRDPRVGFEVERVYQITPPPERACQTHCFYESIVIRGRARIVDGPESRAEKEHALRLLARKYSGARSESPLETVDQTAVVEITIERMTGKEDFGQRWPAERKLRVAKLLYERDGGSAVPIIARMGLDPQQVIGGLRVEAT